MDGFKKFITDYSTQIWTLVSVVVGGIVTYISTSASEHRKNKKQAQKENLEQILIPYCTCLERTIARINQIYQEPAEFFAENGFEKWVSLLREPLEYLEAAKRVFLSQSMRDKLKNYKINVDTFSVTIEQECRNCLIEYRKYILSKLEHFPDVATPMEISCSMDKVVNAMVKNAIINKSDLSLVDNLTGIDFVMNDDPENYQCISVKLNEEIWNTWGAINCGVMDISDIEEEKVEFACSLLNYIKENTSDEREVLSRIIDETQSASMLKNIINELNEMQYKLVKAIDKITN